MQKTATLKMIKKVVEAVESQGSKAEELYIDTRVAIAVSGHKYLEKGNFMRFEGVKEVLSVSKPYKRVTRESKAENTIVDVAGVQFGTNKPIFIAGPCTVESAEQVMEIAKGVKKMGAQMLRGGAFKPRTSPYSFQGLGLDGLKMLKAAGEATGLPVVTEIMATDHLDEVMEHADMLQVGARNMQNFELLKRLSKVDMPILLKRGMASSIEEFLLAAEYLLNGGNEQIVLCERGVKTLENSDRCVLDVNALALIKKLSHLPIIADPSHAAGDHSLVPALGFSALAAGADGLIIEVHNTPENALCDGKQALTLNSFEKFMNKTKSFIQ